MLRITRDPPSPARLETQYLSRTCPPLSCRTPMRRSSEIEHVGSPHREDPCQAELSIRQPDVARRRTDIEETDLVLFGKREHLIERLFRHGPSKVGVDHGAANRITRDIWLSK